MSEITIKPTAKQHVAYQTLFDDETTFIFYGGAAGGGKTWLGCEWFLVTALQYPGVRLFVARREISTLKESVLVSFNEVSQHHKVPQGTWEFNGQNKVITFSNGSTISLLATAYQPSDPDYARFGSTLYTHGWIEEAGEGSGSDSGFKAYDILKSRIGRWKNKEYNLLGKFFVTGNPSKNWTYRTFYKKAKEHGDMHNDKMITWTETFGDEDVNYAFIQALYNDNPFTAKDYKSKLSAISNAADRERLMFGNWEYDDDPSALIIYEYILDLFTNTIDDSKEFYITADIARFGEDKTVIMVWQGLKLIDMEVLSKSSTVVTKDKIKEKINQYGVPYSHVLIDEDGVGGGVVDMLYGVKGFINNSRPLEDQKVKQNFNNLKSQCYYKLADYINHHKISISVKAEKMDNYKEMLIEELEQVKAKDFDKDGKLMVMPKDTIKEHIGRSPDLSDAMMMRMFFEIDHKDTRKRKKAKQFRTSFTY